ncbi:hypothetical protein Taro_050238, partial [Colocasia esculenta]|nr:hypothetical protein [Colocasia esculenta]
EKVDKPRFFSLLIPDGYPTCRTHPLLFETQQNGGHPRPRVPRGHLQLRALAHFFDIIVVASTWWSCFGRLERPPRRATTAAAASPPLSLSSPGANRGIRLRPPRPQRHSGEMAAASASSYSCFMRFSPPLLPSPPLKRILLLPASPLLLASSKSRFSRVAVGSRLCHLFVRSMASGGIPREVEVPRSVPVRVAQELLQAGHRYLDVRTPEEFPAGHAVGAVNVPYMFKVGSGMTKNPKFLEEVSSIFGKDDEIIVGCQMGKRSLMAATDLTSAAFIAAVNSSMQAILKLADY